jgi:copper chaperone CopZ
MKKTIILTIAALMTVSAVTSVASTVTSAESSVLTDKKPAKKKGEIKEVTFNVHLHCENCVKKVQENIAFEKGVKDLHVCLEDQTVSLKYDAAKTSEETLKRAIEKLGYPVSGKREGGHSHGHDHAHGHSHEHNN